MSDLKSIVGQVDIPKGAGVEDVLEVIRAILRLPRVQTVAIEMGVVRYRVLAREDELLDPVGAPDLTQLSLYSILRNADVREAGADGLPLPQAAIAMLSASDQAQLYPLGWIVGPACRLTAVVPYKTLFGAPMFIESRVENDVLFLCCGFVPHESIGATKVVYKYTGPPAGKLSAPKVQEAT